MSFIVCCCHDEREVQLATQEHVNFGNALQVPHLGLYELEVTLVGYALQQTVLGEVVVDLRRQVINFEEGVEH